ncbi:hypothetical protein FFI16_003090 [Pseudomonas sp. KBS0710]|uniref:RHS repeat protein n=1 Tax=Pseudomonas sp. KBS0710 TaxID=1179667 RepID=UPI00110D8877|nr:hypothetical protein [Pseudomonas sp. KBS0710]TSD75443.1 hypothetical protein FFI16_003090 [Pseudomonas sp. KBS0710]
MAHNPMGKDPADYESKPIFNATTQKYNMVNTRTGLFEAYVKMPLLIGNCGSGPEFETDLFYSPTTNNLNALGDGWEFCFTIFSEEYEVLTLSTGETLKLEKGKNLKQPAVIVEWNSDDTLTVYRKGGRTEVLSKLGDTLFYVPKSLTTDGYNYLNLSWSVTPHVIDGTTYHQIKLQRVTDKYRTLLDIDYTLADDNAETAITPVTLTYWPDDPTETLRYKLDIENYALKSITLADDIKSTFEYLDHKSAGWLMIKYTGWEGLKEELEYNDNGLNFPDDPKLSALPCVSEHTLIPNGGGQTVVNRYEYDRSSNLKTYITTKSHREGRTEYTYDYITNEILSEAAIKTVAGVTRSTTTEYTISATPNTIKNQRTTTYRQNASRRESKIVTHFNKDAALTENIENDKRTSYTYADGPRFGSDRPVSETVENVKSLTFFSHKKIYEYISITGMSEPKLEAIDEIINNSLIPKPTVFSQSFVYFTQDDFRKGKPQSIIREGRSLRDFQRSFEYTLGGENNTELTTQITDTVDTSSTRTSSFTQSVLSRHLIRQVDEDGNRCEYTYDSSGRLASQTLCAQSPTYKQTTTYDYPAPGQVKTTEANGQVRLSEYDGQDRLVREYEYVTADTRRLLKEVSYDAIGRELRSTQYDYQASFQGSDPRFSKWSEVTYDNWGEATGRIYSDGSEYFNRYNPITKIRTEWSGKITDKHQKVTTYDLRDDTIKKVEWKDQSGKTFQTQTATYTTAQHLQKLITNGEYGVTTITYTYDILGRVLTEAYVEDDTGLLPLLNLAYTYYYTYDPLSQSNEPTTVEISFGTHKYILGEREFDEWDRVVTFNRGNATEFYTYDGSSLVPATKRTADGIDLKYEYIKELGNKVSKVSTADLSQQKIFTYAHAAQRQSTVKEGERFLEYGHDLNSRVTQQRVQTQPGESKEVSSRYSPAGRLLSYTDVFGVTTACRYNNVGQRIRSENDFFTRYAYNEQGQLAEEVIETKSGATETVNIRYTYDAQQREVSRRFVPTQNTPLALEIATTYFADGKFKQVQLKRGSNVLGSRSFTYSAGGRLKSCTTTGVWRPLNPQGKRIDKQEFTYNGLGNVTQCISTFAGGRNSATYTYDGARGVRLEKIENTHADYTKSASLTYDAADRLAQDQTGKKYRYDTFGRLIQAGSARYSYDPSDRLMTHNQGPDQRQFIYNDLQVNGEYALGDNDDCRHLKPGSAACVAQLTRVSGVERTLYEWCDLNGTVWVTYDATAHTTKFHAYSPYGEHFFEDTHSLLGANRELIESTNGQYPLGCGYRFLISANYQFNTWDTSSPFGEGGPNARGYCADADPINFHDPSGHDPVQDGLRRIWGDNLPGSLGMGKAGELIKTVIFTGLGILTAVMTGGATLLMAAAMVTLATVASALAIVSVVIADSNPELSQGLAWASLVFGVFGGVATLAKKVLQRAALFARCLGNTARAVGKTIFKRATVLSPMQKARLLIGDLPKNMSPVRSLRLIEPFPVNSLLPPETLMFDPIGDLNTIMFAVTGVLGNTGVLDELEEYKTANMLIGNGTYLPNGNWLKLLTMAR